MTVLYFAWVREKIGQSEDELTLPAEVRTVGELVAHLRQKSPGHAEALADPERLRAAVNQTHVDFAYPVNDGDEVAFFPPVTGG